ncbi:MAG TPA: aminotransferase class I/II-fold pyridoxal phosphate-dependent enzyme [Pseudomonadales bacterium]|nr:aminotransferase class I/II-fold pyridoxal phosphate-dependent enzyme [Pseudomonadales bacterium]
MQIEEFSLERIQSLHENLVELNLSDSGVHPFDLRTLLGPEEIEALLDVELGYGWTNGSVALREAIAALYDGRGADEVIVTNGGAEANFLLVMTLVRPGDEVIVVTPNYLQVSGWARAAGATVIEVPLDAAQGWCLDRAAIAAAITPATRLVTLCNPNNPTGTVLADEDLQHLLGLAEKHDFWVHSDEVYKGSELEGDEPPSLADSAGGARSRVIVTNSLSKAMALPGLRIGWLCGPAAEIYAAWQRKDYTSITTAALSEVIAAQVLAPERRARILARSRDWLRGNRDLLATWLEGQPRFQCTLPRAGGMAFLRYDLPVSSSELAERLRTECDLLVVPGDCYGLEGYIRIGIGAPPEVLSEGLKRIGACVEGAWASA